MPDPACAGLFVHHWTLESSNLHRAHYFHLVLLVIVAVGAWLAWGLWLPLAPSSEKIVLFYPDIRRGRLQRS